MTYIFRIALTALLLSGGLEFAGAQTDSNQRFLRFPSLQSEICGGPATESTMRSARLMRPYLSQFERSVMSLAQRRRRSFYDGLRHRWQTLILVDDDKNLQENLQKDKGRNFIYTTRHLNAWWRGIGLTLRPAVTAGYFYQNVVDSDRFAGFDTWNESVYTGTFEGELRLEAPSFDLGILGGIGLGYTDYTKFQTAESGARDLLEDTQQTGLVYTAGVEAAVQVLIIRVVGQVRYLHMPGIEQELVFPALGFQTRSFFLSLLPWIFFLG
ncbi:MAG TPA: hypothetical protein VKA68_03130 [bacterium]|nr:hypothetical protein [bacterium]